MHDILTFGRYGDARGGVVRPLGAGRAEHVDEAGRVGEVGRRQRQLSASGQVAERGGPARRVALLLLLLVLVAPDEEAAAVHQPRPAARGEADGDVGGALGRREDLGDEDGRRGGHHLQ